ncbi:hypothetical protein AC578_4435 [Pseudocercospora eumusae]|uniref:Uncharacterized protein n=1 Tax=Pseudocercospora eumusae TaxID=321146 RepID=A0A139HEY3_9PEZI|nr:hypothetical protein AC578_4435 [Pseudocercospora eumusae]
MAVLGLPPSSSRDASQFEFDPALLQRHQINSTLGMGPTTIREKRPRDSKHAPSATKRHWYQDELFYIRQGCYIFTLAGVDRKVFADDPQPIRISAGARHVPKVDDACEEEHVIEVSSLLSPKGAD